MSKCLVQKTKITFLGPRPPPQKFKRGPFRRVAPDFLRFRGPKNAAPSSKNQVFRGGAPAPETHQLLRNGAPEGATNPLETRRGHHFAGTPGATRPKKCSMDGTGTIGPPGGVRHTIGPPGGVRYTIGPPRFAWAGPGKTWRLWTRVTRVFPYVFLEILNEMRPLEMSKCLVQKNKNHVSRAAPSPPEV